MGLQKVLVILSGGQDSTTCLARAIELFGVDNVHALTFDYGQRHRVEVESAKYIAEKAGLAASHYEVLSMPDILCGTSPLVDKHSNVDQYASVDALPGGLEKTFVPMRNALFLTIAANRAVVLGEGDSHVAIMTGVSQEDYGGYPDCRADFIDALEDAFNSALDDESLPDILVQAPLLEMSKCATVELSESIPGCRDLLAFSHTCYNGTVPPCGKCHACLLRAKGYAEAGVSDPLLDRLSTMKDQDWNVSQ